jgi:hypothetical protein
MDLAKFSQSLGGIKTQQRYLRERVTKIEEREVQRDDRLTEIEFRVNLILLMLVCFYGTLLMGSLWRLI